MEDVLKMRHSRKKHDYSVGGEDVGLGVLRPKKRRGVGGHPKRENKKKVNLTKVTRKNVCRELSGFSVVTSPGQSGLVKVVQQCSKNIPRANTC